MKRTCEEPCYIGSGYGHFFICGSPNLLCQVLNSMEQEDKDDLFQDINQRLATSKIGNRPKPERARERERERRRDRGRDRGR